MGLTESSVNADSLECLFKDVNVYVRPKGYFYRRLKRNFFNEFFDKFSKFLPRKDGIYLFNASLLDNYFKSYKKGVLEIKDDQIIFYYISKGERRSLVWLLMHIRWYGGNLNTFVFESGRLCRYGECLFIGIYVIIIL